VWRPAGDCYVAVSASVSVSPNGGKSATGTPVTQLVETLKIPAGTSGQVKVDLKIDAVIPDLIWIMGSRERANRPVGTLQATHAVKLNIPLVLPYNCTPEGALSLSLPSTIDRSSKTDSSIPDMSTKILVHKASDRPQIDLFFGFDAPVADDFTLKVLARESPYDESPSSDDMLTDNGVTPELVFPRFRITLVPEGVRRIPAVIEYTVYFEVGSADIDKLVKGPRDVSPVDQGKALDDWIKTLVSDPVWKEALASGMVPIRGEARASATLRGKSATENRAFNQQLSIDRKNNVIRRLISHIGCPDTTRMTAIGMSGAGTPGEDVLERRCTIQIDGVALAKEVGKLRQEGNRLGPSAAMGSCSAHMLSAKSRCPRPAAGWPTSTTSPAANFTLARRKRQKICPLEPSNCTCLSAA
jgi:hypothetical protein